MAPLSPDQVASWVEYAEAPWGRLRTDLIWATLERHTSLPPARVLDVGCGLGEIAVRLARAGSEVVAADPSAPMVAEAQNRAGAAPVRWLVADVDRAVAELAGERFDLVLCHNVLGYVADPAAACAGLGTLVASGGALSLTLLNRAAEPLRLAFLLRDLDAAAAAAEDDDRSRVGGAIGVESRLDGIDDAARWLAPAGLKLTATAGMMLVNHYLGADDGLKQTAAGSEAIRRLELALAEREPYFRIAPHFHLIAVSGTGVGT